jgi:hypothetical protein
VATENTTRFTVRNSATDALPAIVAARSDHYTTQKLRAE